VSDTFAHLSIYFIRPVFQSRQTNTWDKPRPRLLRTVLVCEIFFWRDAIPLFTVTYEPYAKGD
jgi:hypothetical protein